MALLIPRTRTDSPPHLVVRRNGGTCWSVTVVVMCDRRPSSSSRRKTQSLRLPVKLHHLGGQVLSAIQLNVSSGITSAAIFPSRRAQSVSQMGRPSLKLALMLSCVKNMSLGRMRRQFGLVSWHARPRRAAASASFAAPPCASPGCWARLRLRSALPAARSPRPQGRHRAPRNPPHLPRRPWPRRRREQPPWHPAHGPRQGKRLGRLREARWRPLRHPSRPPERGAALAEASSWRPSHRQGSATLQLQVQRLLAWLMLLLPRGQQETLAAAAS